MKLSWKKYKIWWIAVVVLVIILLYYSSGYFLVYNNDAYISANWIKVASSVRGHMEEVVVEDNQFVKKGALLFHLKARPFLLAIEHTKAQLDQNIANKSVIEAKLKAARTEISIREAELNLARIEFERYQILMRDGAVSKEMYDEKREQFRIAAGHQRQAHEQVDVLLRQLTQAEAMINQAVSDLGLAEYHYALSKMHATTDGYVNHLRVYAGDHVDIGQELFGFVEADTWKVIANIKETNLPGLKPGKHVWVYLSSYPWHIFEGEITGIASGVARQPIPPNPSLPYVKPVTDWIRYSYRIPVTIKLINFPKDKQLRMGIDARVFTFI